MSLSMILPEGAADAERRRRLRRMRSLAVALLLFAAVVYLITIDRHGFWGYVNAGAEASFCANASVSASLHQRRLRVLLCVSTIGK